jgi:putative Holliday junction resolvase
MNIIAIDFGVKNIGLAWCDTGINVVLPYGVVKNENKTRALEELSDLIKKERIQKVIIGLPLSLDGGDNHNTEKIKKFSSELKNVCDAEIEFFDERFSSQQADRMEGGASRDEKSAMVLLQSYLDKK